MEGRALYLDLLKRCLCNWIYGDCDTLPVSPEGILSPTQVQFLAVRGLHVARRYPFDPQQRAEGRDWPPTAHTMIGLRRLDNLQACVEDVLACGVPGDLLEAGCWQGGATILMRGVLRAYGVADRRVWVADSFAGLPPPDPGRYPADADLHLEQFSYLAVSQERVRGNFERYGLLDEQVCFLPGWFRDSLPTAPVQRLAILRLDGDLYESTMQTLIALYPKLSAGGYLLVDDYGSIRQCRQAVDDYRREHGITEEIRPVDWAGAFWQRAGDPAR